MRIFSCMFFFLTCLTLSFGQPDADYCICDEEAPDFNYFIIEDYQDQEVVSTLNNDFANFNQGWTAPPSFFSGNSSSTTIITTTTTYSTAPTDAPKIAEVPEQDVNTAATPIPEANLPPQQTASSPPAPAGASDAPRNQNRGSGTQRQVRSTQKSKKLNPRIKRKKNQGRLKNKNRKKVKKYRGQCPYF